MIPIELVSGHIILDEDETFSDATVYIRVEDVTLQDVSSEVIATQTISNVNLNSTTNKEGIKFSINKEKIDYNPNHSYSISVHVDVNNDSEISTGDFITVENYPVLTHGHPSFLTVKVKRIE